MLASPLRRADAASLNRIIGNFHTNSDDLDAPVHKDRPYNDLNSWKDLASDSGLV
jgi:hypothetical protein